MRASRLVAACGTAACIAAAHAATWDFEVRLDGKPIGTHRFVVEELAGAASAPDAPIASLASLARTVQSTARFDVKLLGLTVFRYRHEAKERWRGDCLQSVQSRTDDDGKPVQVDKTFADPECPMSYAYWNPALVRQQRLLNPQTGEFDEVRVERLPDGVIPVNGRDVDAVRWRLTATPPTVAGKAAERQQITLWRDRADGRWIGLDAVVKGGRVLSYRLP